MENKMTITWTENGWIITWIPSGKIYVCERSEGELLTTSRLPSVLEMIASKEIPHKSNNYVTE
jgi:hypothetical protein